MHRLLPLLYPLTSLALLVLIWDLAVRFFSIPDYLLPPPAAVYRALADGFSDRSLWPHIATTLGETLTGYATGSLLAVLLGVALAESQTFERFVYPLLIALQATPKVALGPIILVWFGYGAASKIVLVTLVCFFPLFVNTVNGIRRADTDLLDACRAFSASRLYLLFHVKLPSAAGEVFSGLQIGVALALIGAVVAEFLSAQRGLGYLIASSSVSMNLSTMFAGVILLALIGLCGAQTVRWLQRRVIFWQPDAVRRRRR
ncbi:ABC transporter permease [Brenneria tiliae]|uniref:ABC transporter permease n=1 Tax=Brenneria tiliae TaxID=2914984 RepID=UPI002014AE78|nr:ABC transporter permease [Brenneria tiliae]MCL2898484.1 ABC transporter permease [Brenneria tiliae]MCL2902974.1 ABC transporter permease [Brenneria tiliae]